MRAFDFLLLAGIGVWARAAESGPRKALFVQISLGKSHTQFAQTLIQKLAGHGYVVDELIFNYNIDIPSDGSPHARHLFKLDHPNTTYHKIQHIANPFTMNLTQTMETLRHCRLIFCERIMADKELVDRLKAEKYDVFFTQPFDGCSLPLAHILGIKSTLLYVSTASADFIYEGHGVPTPPSYLSYVFYPFATERPLTFLERLANWALWVRLNAGFAHFRNLEDPVVQRHYPRTPTYTQLYARVQFVFVNIPEVLDVGRPLSAKFRFVGGIGMEDHPQRALPAAYADLLAERNATILFSLGSLVQSRTIPAPIYRSFLDAFAHLTDYTVIWKHDQPENATGREFAHIKFRKWIPQQQLLADPRVRLFVSHMGVNSYVEAARQGVPLLMVPLFADQDFNAGVAARKGLGLVLRRGQLDARSLRRALRRVLSEPGFGQRAQLVARLLRRQQEMRSASARFLDAVDLAAAFPELAQLLELPAARLHFVVANSLDVLLFVFVSVTAFVAAALCALVGLCRFCRRKRTTPKLEKVE